MGSAPSRPVVVLTRSERQDELVSNLPDGVAKVIRRPKTNPDGSDIVTTSDFEFPDTSCYRFCEKLHKALRLNEERDALHYSWLIRDLCGIQVDLGGMKNFYATSSILDKQN